MKLPKRVNTKRELQPMAKAIQAAMKAKGLDVPALTEAMGMEKSQRGAVTNWVVGVHGPSAQLRPKLAAVLGLREDQLVAPRPGSGRSVANLKLGPAQRAVALVETARVNGEILPSVPPVTDVFSIRARTDGSMIIKLDANLPYARGTQLVQFLLQFGLVIGAEPDAPP